MTGSASNFNRQTNVDLNNPYTVIDISDLTGDMLVVGTFIAFTFTFAKVKEDITKAKLLVVDEAWQIIGASSNSLAANYIFEAVKTIRGYGGAPLIATQDISDFFALEDGKYGRGILNNCKIKIILNLEEDEAQLVQKVLKLTDAETRLAETEGRLARALPAAESYEKVKDRTAGIELEAHCRAQAVQAEAEERVEQARRDMEQWLNKVRKSYEELRTDIDATVSHTSGELERVRATLEEITNRFCAQDERLEKMVQSCIGEHKAPDPLPLEDKK